MKNLLGIAFGALALLLGASSLVAHPHVFIDGILSPIVSSDGKYLEGAEIEWNFDQIYSSQMILDFDQNKDGRIDEAEEKLVYEQAFVHLKELDYFLEVEEKKGNKKIFLGSASRFRASIRDDKFIFQFYIPFLGATSQGLSLDGTEEFLIFLEDAEYFIAFNSLLKPGLHLAGVQVLNKEIMVENLQWGPYSVRAISVKGL